MVPCRRSSGGPGAVEIACCGETLIEKREPVRTSGALFRSHHRCDSLGAVIKKLVQFQECKLCEAIAWRVSEWIRIRLMLLKCGNQRGDCLFVNAEQQFRSRGS